MVSLGANSKIMGSLFKAGKGCGLGMACEGTRWEAFKEQQYLFTADIPCVLHLLISGLHTSDEILAWFHALVTRKLCATAQINLYIISTK